MKKRILSLLLTIAMLTSLLTCLPATVGAADEPEAAWAISADGSEPDEAAYTNTGTLSDALSAAPTDGSVLYVKLRTDVSSTTGKRSQLRNDTKAVLDLNGKTISVITNTMTEGITSSGDLTVKNGTIYTESSSGNWNQCIRSSGTLTVSDCTLTAKSTGQTNAHAISYLGSSTVKISNCTLSAEGPKEAAGVYIQCSSGAVTPYVSNTTITASSTTGKGYGIYFYSSNPAVYISGSKSISGTTADICLKSKATKLYANDGADTPTYYTGDKIDLAYSSTSASNLPALNDVVVYGVNDANKDKFSLPASILGEDKELKMNAGNLVLEEKVVAAPTDAKWGFGEPGIENFTNYTGAGYFNDAIAAANGNTDTTNTVTYIQLQKDLKFDLSGNGLFTINNNRTAVLDLNNKTITVNDYGNKSSSITNITVKGDLTLKNGTINITNDKALSKNYIGINVDPVYAKALNIDNCTISVNTPNSPKLTYGIMCGQDGTTQAVVTVTNSTINVNAKRALGVSAHSSLVLKLSDSTVTATNLDNGTQEGYAIYAIKTNVYLSGNTSLSGTNAGIYLPYFESSIYAHDGAAQNQKPFTGNDIIVDGDEFLYDRSVGKIVINDVTDANIGKFKLHENKTEITLKKNDNDLVLAKKVAKTPVTAIDFDLNWDNMVSINDSANSSYTFSGDFVISNPAGVFESPAVMGMWWVYNPSLASEGFAWEPLSEYDSELTDDTRIAVMFGVMEKAEYTIQGLTTDKITYKGNPIVKAQIDPVENGSDIYGALVLVEVGTKADVDEKFGGDAGGDKITSLYIDINWDNVQSYENADGSYIMDDEFKAFIPDPANAVDMLGYVWFYHDGTEFIPVTPSTVLTANTRLAIMVEAASKDGAFYMTPDSITVSEDFGSKVLAAVDESYHQGMRVLVEVGTKAEVDQLLGIGGDAGDTPDAPEAGTIENIQDIVAVDATNKTVTVTPKSGEENYIYYSIVIPTAALVGSTMTPEQYVAMVMGGVGKSIPDVTGYDLTSAETVATLNTLTMAGQTYITNISASNMLEWTLESSSVVIVYKLLEENSKSQTYSSPSSNPFMPGQPNAYAYGIYGAYATIVEIAGGDTTEPTFDSAEFAFTYADTIGKIVVGEALPDLSSLTNTIVIKDTAGNIIPATVELEWLAQGGEEGWGWADSNAQEGVEYGIRVGVNAEGYLFDNTAATFTCTDDKLTISVVWPGDNGFAAVVAAKKEPVIEDPTVTAPDHNNGDVTVGGLKDEAEKVADEVAAANPGADITVSVDMTVDVQASDVVKQTEKTAIEEIAASQSKNLEYLDIIIEKTVTINNGTPTTDPINKTNGLVTITINFPTDGKTDFKIYRYHDKHSTEHTGNVQVLTTTPNSHGEYIAVGNGQITIYAKYFSTYAIGYTTASTPVSYTVTVTNGTGDGEYEAGATVTITADAAPSGKVFDKWIVSGAFPANANNAITTFTMPDHDVTVVATYKDDANDRYDDWYWTMLLLYSKKYDITATATGGGEIDPAGVTKVQYSKSITYTITPDAGYAIKSVLVDGKDVGAVNTYTFKNVTKKHTIHAIFEAVNPYTDVKANDWFYEDVLFVTAKSLMNGTGNGKFSPEITTDRAMLVTVLWRLEGSPVVDSSVDFTDVADGQWYSEAIDWASANGIVNGYGNGKFGPTDQITREQIMAILNRYAAYKNWTDGIALPMLPQYNCSIWAENNVIWADMSGLLDNLGVDVYDMTAKASRAELAAYLSRFMKNIAK